MSRCDFCNYGKPSSNTSLWVKGRDLMYTGLHVIGWCPSAANRRVPQHFVLVDLRFFFRSCMFRSNSVHCCTVWHRKGSADSYITYIIWREDAKEIENGAPDAFTCLPVPFAAGLQVAPEALLCSVALYVCRLPRYPQNSWRLRPSSNTAGGWQLLRFWLGLYLNTQKHINTLFSDNNPLIQSCYPQKARLYGLIAYV